MPGDDSDVPMVLARESVKPEIGGQGVAQGMVGEAKEALPGGRGRGRALAALRQRNFRLYWSGQALSVVGTAMQGVGQAWLVLQLTGSPWQLGLVGALQGLPLLFFALFGGLLADRWPKRRVLLLTQTASMVQALLLWLLLTSGMIQLWHLYLLALFLGLTNSLNRPVSRSFLSELVGREDLPNAVGLSTSTSTLAMVIGPGLAGILIAASGVNLLFLINALSFLPVLLALALLDRRQLLLSEGIGRRGQPLWRSLGEGLSYVWQTPDVRVLIFVGGLILLFGSNFGVLLPLFATEVLHSGVTGFGFLSAASDTGALLASLWLAWRSRASSVRGLFLGMLAFVLLEAAFALSRSEPISLLLIAGVGCMEIGFAASCMALLQTLVPDHLRGRAIGVQVLLFDGSLPLGYLLLGWLSTACGPALALLISSGLCLITLAIGWLGYRRMPVHR